MMIGQRQCSTRAMLGSNRMLMLNVSDATTGRGAHKGATAPKCDAQGASAGKFGRLCLWRGRCVPWPCIPGKRCGTPLQAACTLQTLRSPPAMQAARLLAGHMQRLIWPPALIAHTQVTPCTHATEAQDPWNGAVQRDGATAQTSAVSQER